MSLAKATAKNISTLLLARILFRFLNAIALIYAARYLGNDRYGMYTTATAWANAFIALNDVGMSTLMLRAGAREPERMSFYFGNTLLIESLLSIVIWLGLIVVGISLYDTTTAWLMVILGASNLVYEFRKVMRGVFRSHQNLRPVALTELFNGATFCLATFAMIFFVQNRDTGLFAIAHASLWTDVISVLILFIITLRVLKPHLALDQLWGMIKQAWPFTIYNLFYMIYFQVDQIIISLLLTSSAVGVYSAPTQIVMVLLFIPIMVFQVTTPLMYKFASDDPKKYARIHRIMWRYLSAFGVPAGIGLWMLAKPTLAFVYGNNYFQHDPALLDQAVLIMQIFGWFLAIRFIGIAHGNSLTTSDRQKLRARMQTVSVGVNIVLDLFLVPLYGPAGAAIATLITEVGITSTTMYLASAHVGETLWSIVRGLTPIAAATAVMAATVTLISQRFSVIVLVILGASIYLAALWVFRFFTPKDRALITEIFSSRRARKQQA